MKNTVKITISGSVLEDAATRLMNAWHRAERGEVLCERHWSFESYETYLRVLAGRTEAEAIREEFGADELD